MIGEILGTINIVEKTGRFIDWIRTSRKSPIETVSSRFIKLFESHDVHRNQIPRFFGHGLTIKDLQNEALLLDKLDEPLLDAACNLFGVRREWLEGADTQIYQYYDFYKKPEEAAPFILKLINNNPEGNLDGILLVPAERKDDAIIVLNEIIGWVGEKPIYRYHLCNNWLFDYWKSRAYLTAFIAIAWKHKVYIRGGYLPLKEIKQLAEGESFLNIEDGSISRIGQFRYPEDMAIEPEAFLSGIDPERDKFGLKAGLEMWLSLEKEGFMDAGLSMYPKESIRSSFIQALDSI